MALLYDLSTTLNKSLVSKCQLNASRENTTCLCMWIGLCWIVAALWSLWLLKRALELLIIQRVPSKTNTTTFSIRTLYTQGITYNPCPESCRKVFLTDIISGPFNYDEQICYLHILIREIKGNDECVRGGDVCSQITLTLNKSTVTSNQMCPIWSLYDRLFNKNYIFPHGITYSPIPREIVGCVNTRGIIICFLHYFQQKGSHNFNLTRLVKSGVVRGGAKYPLSLLTLKNDLEVPIFNQMSLF